MGNELNTLRELRERALDEAEAALVAARAEVALRERAVAEAARLLAEADRTLAARRAGSPDRRGGAFSSGAWVDEQRFQQRLVRTRDARARDHTAAVDASARAAQGAEQARQAVVEAKREVEVLVKHGARIDAREQLQRRRRAEREEDDLASARHGRK